MDKSRETAFGRFVFAHLFAEHVAQHQVSETDGGPELPTHSDILRQRYAEGRLYWASAGPTYFNDPDGLMVTLFECALRTAFRLAPRPFNAVAGGNAGAAIEDLLKVHHRAAEHAGFGTEVSQLAVLLGRPGQTVDGYTGTSRLAMPTASVDRRGSMLALLGDAVTISAMGQGTAAERMRFGAWAKLDAFNLEQPNHAGAFVISFPFQHGAGNCRTGDWDRMFREHGVACGSIQPTETAALDQFPIFQIDSAADCEHIGQALGEAIAFRMQLRLQELEIERPIVLRAIEQAEACFQAARASGCLDHF